MDRFGVCFEMGKKLHSIALIMELNDCCVIFFILAGFDFVQGSLALFCKKKSNTGGS